MAKASDFLIALSDGHGSETPGKRTPYIPELGRSIKENEFNSAVTDILEAELKRCGFRTIQVAPTDADISLKARTDLANSKGAHAYVSNHYDALDGKFDDTIKDGKDPDGFTVYVYTGQKTKNSGKLANLILEEMIKGTPEQDSRGVKEANFHEVRESNMIAALIENGFMDNRVECKLMIDRNFQKKRAIQEAKAICRYFGVPYVPYVAPAPVKPAAKPSVSSKSKLYKVQVGAFGVKDNASNLVKELEAKGYKPIIVEEDR